MELIRKCKECGKEFVPTRNNNYYCNHKCYFIRYSNSQKGKERNLKYAKTQKGYKAQLKAYKNYHNTIKGKIRDIKYRNSKKGKELEKKIKAKRKRNLSFIPIMDNPFPKDINIHWHHINNLFVVPIPAVTHKTSFGYGKFKHREFCNNILRKFNFSINIFGGGTNG